MAVSPDLMLNIKATPPAAKSASTAPKPTAQASRDEASSFANVYARERQAKPAERSEPAAKQSRDKPVDEKASQKTAEAVGSDKPVTAEAGKSLPAEATDTETVDAVGDDQLDPLLMLGIGGQPDPLASQLPPAGSEFLVALPQTQQAEADGEGLSDELLLSQSSSLGVQTTAEKATNQLLTKASSVVMDAAPLAMALNADEALGEQGDEVPLEEDFSSLLEQLGTKDSPSTAPDTSTNRLNPLSQAIAQQNLQAQRPPLVPGQAVQIQESGWSEAVVDRVMWLSSQNLKSAEIQLDPAELGRMEVRIEMTKDQTQVTFTSPHANVRDALENQMHRLRDMFAQQGMTMDVNVSDQSHARGWQGQGGDESRGGRGRDGAATAEDETVIGSMDISSSRVSGDRGLVDYYA